jgi:hypothetical protein
MFYDLLVLTNIMGNPLWRFWKYLFGEEKLVLSCNLFASHYGRIPSGCYGVFVRSIYILMDILRGFVSDADKLYDPGHGEITLRSGLMKPQGGPSNPPSLGFPAPAGWLAGRPLPPHLQGPTTTHSQRSMPYCW